MICDVCGKQKATVHLTEIINDQVSKLNICEYCAKKKGSQMEQHFGIADLLQGLADPTEKGVIGAGAKVKCAACGMAYDEFKKIGRLGCAQCYDAFRESIAPLLKRIHSAGTHTGKHPKNYDPAAPAPAATSGPSATSEGLKPAAAPKTKAGSAAAEPSVQSAASASVPGKTSADLQQLKQALKKAIDSEAYEEAARIRDQVRQLEAKQKKGGA
jgi:protein arginine kinase activator